MAGHEDRLSDDRNQHKHQGLPVEPLLPEEPAGGGFWSGGGMVVEPEESAEPEGAGAGVTVPVPVEPLVLPEGSVVIVPVEPVLPVPIPLVSPPVALPVVPVPSPPRLQAPSISAEVRAKPNAIGRSFMILPPLVCETK